MTTNTLPEAYVLSANDGQFLGNLGLRLVATDAQTGGTMLAAVCTNPGPGGPPLHTHAAVDEFYLVLEGTYRFKIGDREAEGGAGTCVYAPRGTSHTFAGVGHEEGRLFLLTLPGTEQFLRGISRLQAHGMDQREMQAHFHAFQSEIDGPPLA